MATLYRVSPNQYGAILLTDCIYMKLLFVFFFFFCMLFIAEFGNECVSCLFLSNGRMHNLLGHEDSYLWGPSAGSVFAAWPLKELWLSIFPQIIKGVFSGFSGTLVFLYSILDMVRIPKLSIWACTLHYTCMDWI